jgi:SagB-type dehydrogenase family enzyme
MRKRRYRRAAHLVCHWEKGQFFLHNYATNHRAPGTPLAIEILDLCEEWRPASALLAELRALDSTVLDTVLSALVEFTFLEQSDRPASPNSALYDAWEGWRPAAAYFHAATKDVRYGDSRTVDALLRRKADEAPPPAPLKPIARGAKAAKINGDVVVLAPPALPSSEAAGETLRDALRERRTWRQFGAAAISAEHLGTLMGLTFGVQQWMHVDGFGRMALKTSPSGGARHSIEAYAYVRRVSGMPRGWYHYDPDRHLLRPLEKTSSRSRRISAYLPKQNWYDGAAVFIAMTAVFARARWRYGYPRAYRSILTEAGHLAQTFCLVATSLQLAPFCSMALADSVIERDLGIDGVSESVLYATGAGHRPKGIDWAPWPDTVRTPRIEQPAWKRRTLK